MIFSPTLTLVDEEYPSISLLSVPFVIRQAAVPRNWFSEYVSIITPKIETTTYSLYERSHIIMSDIYEVILIQKAKHHLDKVVKRSLILDLKCYGVLMVPRRIR